MKPTGLQSSPVITFTGGFTSGPAGAVTRGFGGLFTLGGETLIGIEKRPGFSKPGLD